MRKNILILGHNYATQFIDIYNQYTKLFDPNQYNVTVAYLTGEPNDDVIKRTLASDVIFLDMPKKDIRTLKVNAIRKLGALCREKNYQLIICHRYKPTYIMLWVAQFQRIPRLVFVMHELRTMSALSRRLIMRALFRKNMLLAGVSNAVRDDMRKNLSTIPKDQVVTLYNMIDLELTEPQLFSRDAARAKLNLPVDAFLYFNLARLAVNKDQKNLIKAFSIVKQNAPNAKLVLMGDGELEDELKAYADSLGLKNEVIFAGFVANAFRYMKAFDCFVLSSIQEAFGRVLLEAMIAKRPIIATTVNGIPEVVGNAGTLIQPKDATMLADAMLNTYTLSPNERDQLGERGYQRALENFSIPEFHKQFWALPLMQTLAGKSL